MTLVAYPERVEREGEAVYRYEGGKDPLAWAVENSSPNGEDVILHYMSPQGIAIASGENYRRFEVVREAPFDVRIIGANMESGLRYFRAGDKGGGFKLVTFEDMTIDGRTSQRVCQTETNTYGGTLKGKRLMVRTNPLKTQFGWRSNGSHRIVMIDVDFPDGGNEWAVYDDWAPGRNRYVRVTARNWWRGGIQRVLRPYSNPKTVLEDGGTFIEHCAFYDCGSAGAAAVTINGFWGVVNITGLTVSSPYKTSAIVFTFDAKQAIQPFPWKPLGQRGPIIKPGFVNPDGRAGGGLEVIGLDAYLPESDRSVMNIDSLAKLKISVGRKWRVVEANKWAVDLEPNGWEKSEFYDRSIGEVELEGDFSEWKSQGFRRRLEPFTP